MTGSEINDAKAFALFVAMTVIGYALIAERMTRQISPVPGQKRLPALNFALWVVVGTVAVACGSYGLWQFHLQILVKFLAIVGILTVIALPVIFHYIEREPRDRHGTS